MANRTECCRYEPSLDELLDDDILHLMMHSDGFDREQLHDLMDEARHRIGLSREIERGCD
jgi:hypothetical protein